jgi:hypothetical protein
VITEPPSDDPRLVWQEQRKEHPTMSLEDVRFRVHEAQLKIRRNLIVILITSVLLLGVSAVALIMIPRTSARIIAAGMIAATLFVAVLGYSRMWRRTTPAADATTRGCLQFYRKELEAQYRSVQFTWRLFLILAVFAFMTSNSVFRPNPTFPKAVVVVVLALSLIVRQREKQNVNRKLTALDEFEKETS